MKEGSDIKIEKIEDTTFLGESVGRRFLGVVGGGKKIKRR